MVTHITPRVRHDGSGRDCYIHRDPAFVHGAYAASKPRGWSEGLRSSPPAPAREDHTLESWQPRHHMPPELERVVRGARSATPRASNRWPRSDWVPTGGAPRRVTAPWAIAEKMPVPKLGNKAALHIELGRALWLGDIDHPFEQAPRRPHYRLERPVSAEQPSLPLTTTVPLRSCSPSATAARAAERAALRGRRPASRA